MTTDDPVAAALREIKELLRDFLEAQRQASAEIGIAEEIRIAEATGDPLAYWKARCGAGKKKE